MRLLRHTGAPLLLSVLLTQAGCPDTIIIQQPPPDDDTTTVAATTSDDDDDETSRGESTSDDGPPDDTTTTGVDSGSETAASTDETGSQGQACGNGVIEGTEQCDCGGMPCSPAGLGGNMCVGIVNPVFPDRYYTGGILDCSPASCQFNFVTCTYCGDENLNGNEICEDGDNGPSCSDLGLGSSTSDLPCGPTCQWYIECCEAMPPKDC
jgi:hypothetical protein